MNFAHYKHADIIIMLSSECFTRFNEYVQPCKSHACWSAYGNVGIVVVNDLHVCYLHCMYWRLQ